MLSDFCEAVVYGAGFGLGWRLCVLLVDAAQGILSHI